jgi:hypothetical protein
LKQAIHEESIGGHRAQGAALKAEMEEKIQSLEDERRALTTELERTKRSSELAATQSSRDFELQLSHLQQLLSEAKLRADSAEVVSSKLAGEVAEMRRGEIAARDSEHSAKDNLSRRSLDFASELEARDLEIGRLQEQADELAGELDRICQSKDEAEREFGSRLAYLRIQIPGKVVRDAHAIGFSSPSRHSHQSFPSHRQISSLRNDQRLMRAEVAAAVEREVSAALHMVEDFQQLLRGGLQAAQARISESCDRLNQRFLGAG